MATCVVCSAAPVTSDLLRYKHACIGFPTFKVLLLSFLTRGTNNAFQKKFDTILSQLYTTSPMERHHFNQCITILNSDGCKITANLTDAQTETVNGIIESAIMATDLSRHFAVRGEFQVLRKHSHEALSKHVYSLAGAP